MLLFDDLLQSAGRAYFYGLNFAPGSIVPTTCILTFGGQIPIAVEPITIFRSPPQAALTLSGQRLQNLSQQVPATSNLGFQGKAPTLQLIRIISPALPMPDYNNLQDTAPTILFLDGISPQPAVLFMQGLLPNAGPGGNIAFVSPAKAQLQVAGAAPVAIFTIARIGDLFIQGNAPRLIFGGIVEPDPTMLFLDGFDVTLERSFLWVNVPREDPEGWVTIPRAQ